MLSSLTLASLSGTAQLLTLCLAGAYLTHRDILTPSLTKSLSACVYHAFLPSLLFTSTLTLGQTIPTGTAGATNFLAFLPPAWALLTLLISAITALPATILTRPPLRRTIFVALLLGNANNLPLLLLHTLCDELPLGENCYNRANGYVALYLAAWNTLMWTLVLQYLRGTPDTDGYDPPGDVVLIRGIEDAEGGLLSHTASQASTASVGSGVRCQCEKVCSPPFLAIVIGGLLGVVPSIGGFTTVYLHAFLHALTLLGRMVVPMSSIIVGSRLYSHRMSPSLPADTSKIHIRPWTVMLVILTRFVLLPMVGRFVYGLLGMSLFVTDPLLRIYLLVPYFMPTASNTVVMVQMAALGKRHVGEIMEAGLLIVIFWQYVFAPVCLTLNMAVGLSVVKEGTMLGE